MGLFDLIGTKNKSKSNLAKVSWDQSSYDFRTADFIDARLCRSIYRNTETRYKLAGGLSKPVVNSYANFMGNPVVTATKKRKLELETFIKKIAPEAHVLSLSEGIITYWLKWDDDTKEVVYQAIPEDQIKYKLYDFDGLTLIQLVVSQNVKFYIEENGVYNAKNTDREIVFDKQNIVITYKGDIPPHEKAKTVIRHNLGRLPLSYKKNEHYSFEVNGHSELEPIEPYLAGYHDVMKNRLIEDKRTSRKKLIIGTWDVASFIKNNLIMNGFDGESTSDFDFENFDVYAATARGESFETIKYLDPGQTATDSIAIAKILFQNIVETSNVPEWAFAAKLGASFASAKVQEPAWLKAINRKRENDMFFWNDITSLYMQIKDKASVSNQNKNVKINWEEITLESQEVRARIVSQMVNSVSKAVENGIMDYEESREYMQSYIRSLKDVGEFNKGFDGYIEQLESVKSAVFKARGSEEQPSDDNKADINYKNREKDEK